MRFPPHWSFILTGCALALVVSQLRSTADAAEDPALYELPLRSAGCGITNAPDVPALTIVSLPKDYWSKAEIAGVDHGPDPAWAGAWPEDVRLDRVVARDGDAAPGAQVPFADQDTVALISAEGQLRPLDLQRRGNHFYLRCEAIPEALHDEAGTPKHPRREVHAVSLGRLAAGAYVCDLSIGWRAPEAANPVLFDWRKNSWGSLAFTVWHPFTDNHRADPGKPVSLSDAQLVSPPESASPDRPPWQVPRSLSRSYGGDRPAGLFGVGPIDLTALGTEPVANPIMPHGGGHQVAIILGPVLNAGEWLRLRSVTARNGVWMVTVETWQDDGPRRKNLEHRELLAVPIDGAADLAVPPRVELQWRRLRAPDQDGGYLEQRAEAMAGPAGGQDHEQADETTSHAGARQTIRTPIDEGAAKPAQPPAPVPTPAKAPRDF